MAQANSTPKRILESPAISVDPGIPDTVRLMGATTGLGQPLILPIHFFCDEELGGMQVLLGYDPLELVCDSVSFVGSTVTLGGGLSSIDSVAGIVNAGILYVSENVIPPQTGILGFAFFSQVGPPHGTTYQFDTTSIQVDPTTVIQTILSTTNPATSIFPEFVAASILVLDYTPGDANNDQKVSIADVTFLISRIFTNGPAPPIPAAADADASCTVSIGDVTFLIARIFSGGEAPRLGCAQ
jgi:hypothetical protein